MEVKKGSGGASGGEEEDEEDEEHEEEEKEAPVLTAEDVTSAPKFGKLMPKKKSCK